MQNFSSIHSRASVCVCVRLVNYPFKLLDFSSRGKGFAARWEAGVWALSLNHTALSTIIQATPHQLCWH